jgi:hypothetical protein
MSLTAGGRGHVEGEKTISRSASSTFHLPPYTQAKRWHEVPPADGVREVGDFTLRRGGPPPSRGYRFEGQAPTLVGAGPICQFASEER